MNAKWLGLVLLAALSTSAAEVTIRVGPNGDTKTIEEGLQRARARKDGDYVRIVVSGTHYLGKPILLTEKDSGTTIEGSDKGATLSGGRALKGFRKGQGNLWEVQIPEVKEGMWYFRQLFVNGERRQRARTPNAGYFRIQGPSPQDRPIQLKFKAGDVKKAWAAHGDVEVVGYLAWADFRMFVRDVDEAANVATLSGDPRPSNKEANAQYFIENAPDGLDAPGEWYLDRTSGVLRYWPLPNENMASADIVAPRLEELAVVRGNAEKKKAAERITFRNLTFAHTDYELGAQGVADTQAAVAVRGDVLFEFAKDCVVEDCVFKHLGGYGVELGRGGQGIKVRRSEIVDLGGGGVRIGETAKRVEGFDANHSNEVSDCHLHKLGRVFAPAVGVFILQSGTNLISHNHIHDLYYTAVSVGWNWGYQETPCRANVIEFNHMHDVGQNLLSDMGAVYTLGIQRGTVIRNNLIHDVNAFTYGGWGLYTDEGSSDILLENNVVYRCKSAGFHQHYGRDNMVRNNVFAFGRESQLMRTREEPHNSFTFERNIVYFDSGELLGSNWSNEKFTMNNNFYFDARPGAKVTFKGASLEEWQARGHDRNSVVADPLFVDVSKNDFRLRADSSALRSGFKQIDLSTVGPRGKAR